MKRLSIWILYPSVPLVVAWMIFQTVTDKTENLGHDPIFAALMVPFIVSLLLYVFSLIQDKKVKTIGFGFHLSLLLGLVLLFANEFVTEKGEIAILEGETLDFYKETNGNKHSLPFNLECKDFQLTLYPGTQRASSFRTILKVEENKKSYDVDLEVNNPLEIQGYKLFQTDYGLEPNPNHRIPLTITGPGTNKTLQAKIGETVMLANGSILSVLDFSPSWAVKEHQIITFDQDALKKPAYLIRIQTPMEEDVAGWVLPSSEDSWNLGQWKIIPGQIWGIEYSVISVVRSPLTPYILFVCFLITVFGTVLLWKKISWRNIS